MGGYDRATHHSGGEDTALTKYRSRRATIVASATIALVALGACSSASSSAAHSSARGTMGSSTGPATGPAASGPHNIADVSFASDLIPHHAQAVLMADMALNAATDPRVRTFATAVKHAQEPEIVQMRGWLEGWAEPVPDASVSGMSRGTGMMRDTEMAGLSKATGRAFDRMWVQMMITHHEGAVTMAKRERAAGRSTDATNLATAVIATQSRQVIELRRLLKTLAA